MTKVYTETGIREMKDVKKGEFVESFNVETGLSHFVEVVDIEVHDAVLWEFEMDDGSTVTCSMDHKFLTDSGMRPMKEIVENNLSIIAK